MKRCLRGCRESPIPAPSPLVQPRPAQASSGQVKSSRTRPGPRSSPCAVLLLSSVELLLCCAVKVVRPSVFFEGPAANNSTLALASPIPPFPRPPPLPAAPAPAPAQPQPQLHLDLVQLPSPTFCLPDHHLELPRITKQILLLLHGTDTTSTQHRCYIILL